MKKLLLLFLFLTISLAQAQYNINAPWMKELISANKSTSIKFQDIVNAANTYWEKHDKEAKGSGYKPFKRWESYWKNYINEDGYLPTSTQLWNTWLAKKAQTATQRSSLGILADESNWVSLGPTNFVNQATSTANIGRINSIMVDPNNPNVYYAGAPAGGIWKSVDAGLNWIPLSDELPKIGVSGIAIDHNNSNIIYIATGDDDHSDTTSVGVFKSIDGGISWSQTGLNPTSSPSLMNDIYVHPTNSNILWVATNNGVYKTINAGISWTQTLTGDIRDIKIKPGNPNIVYAVSSSTFYKSINAGDTFTATSTGLPVTSGRLVMDVTPANAEVVYAVSATAGNGYQGIFKSIDSGATFTQQANSVDIFESTQAWYDLALAVSDSNENEIYVGVLNVWKSSNGGGSFSQINQWLSHTPSFTHADIHILRFYNGDLFAGTDGGFYKSSNGGSSFTDLTKGMEISQFYKISVSQQTSAKIAGGLQDNGGFSYVSNQWNHYHGGDGMEGVIDPNNDNLYYGFMQNGEYLFVSSSSGQSSGTQSFAGPESGNWITPLAINKESEIFAGYSKIYQFNNGLWAAISPAFGSNVDALEIDPAQSNNMYVAINNSLWKSTDKAVSFSNVETFPTNITSIEVNNNTNNIVYVTTAGTSSGKVFKSIDEGLTFTDITGSLPNVTKNIIKHKSEDPLNALYLGTSIGMYSYNDNTAIWEVFENNLPNTPVLDLAISTADNNITAATFGRGVWRSVLPVSQLALNDVKLVNITNPIALGLNCGNLTPQIDVKNNGQNSISSINVTYNIDAGADNNFTWSGFLASEASTTIDIPTFNLQRGSHDLIINTTIINDTFANNNSSSTTFLTNDNGVAQSINTFETVGDELNTLNTNGSQSLWERGQPTGTLLNTTVSGNNLYGTNLSGNYTDSTVSYLYSQCYDLNTIGNPILKFYMAFDLESDWDLVYVEYTLDEGATWSLLGNATEPNWYNSSRFSGDGIADNCFNCVGGQWTGTNSTLTQFSHDLNAITNESSVIFRVVFQSDVAVNNEGVILDDLVIDGTTLGIENFAVDNILIYPNPSKNIFNIKIKGVSKLNLNVNDVTGKLVLTKKNANLSQGSYTLDMTDYSAGMYFLNIVDADGRNATIKLILN